jgi:hypothetical protein
MKLTNKIKSFVLAGLAVLTLGLAVAPATSTYAAKTCDPTQGGLAGGIDCINPNENEPTLEERVKTIINVVIYVVGILAVVMVIYGGVRYTLSEGSEKKVTDAKNTIMYGVIGLIVCILAFAIVNFVIGAFTS